MEAIRCTEPTCRCDCFSPGKSYLRTCDTCKHGWVAHALEKLGNRTTSQLGMQVEIVQPNIVFDIASLILYGAQATPIRLKILLDRLFSVLQHDEVLQVLHGFGWSYEDYARGYILQDSSGRVLDKWIVTTREEEHVILQQFLRFGETKSIAQEIILQDTRDNRSEKPSFPMSPKSESEIKKFIERSNVGMQSFMRGYDPRTLLNNALPFPTSTANLTRLLTPTPVPAFPAPINAKRDLGGMLLPVSPANALTGSPLTRLQTMQPFDYRREHISPNLSPSASDKSASTSQSEHRSPQNLSLGAVTPNSLCSSVSPGHIMFHSPIKAEIAEMKMLQSPAVTPVKHDVSAMDGVLNFSLKDQKSLANTPPRPRIQSPVTHTSPRAMSSPRSMSSPRTPPTSMHSSSHYAEQKIKHLRKSSNPMKRPWQPTPGYGGTLISPSGKKRVLCTACNKTFCDKGALKIHYSAVHLKEMHKCSVDGCNMMFSSRRSRNRHSANPNPKLHMPQARRKLTDGGMSPGMGDEHDDSDHGMSEQDHVPALQRMPPAMPGLITPGMITPHPALGDLSHIHQPPNEEPKDLTKEASAPLALPPHPVVTTTNASGEMIYYLDPAALAGIPQQLLPLPPKLNKESDDSTEVASDRPSAALEESSSSAGTKVRSSRKRKCLAPTRCTQMEDAFVMSDEEGLGGAGNEDDLDKADTYKSRRLEAERTGSKYNSEDEGGQRSEDESESDIGVMGELMTTSGDDDGDSSPVSSPEKVHNQPTEQSACTPGSQNCEPEVKNGDEYPAENNRDAAEADEDMNNDYMEEEDEDGIHSDSSMNGLDVDDIPVDKDNPKKCPSCGKIFPNLFTVKTHYQNVHLKLMHNCTVEGCNAAFPSKRSRDRHSSNLNLHRKLLSTTTEADMNSRNLSLREEFLPRIYDQQQQFTGSGMPPVTRLDDPEDDVIEANNNNRSSGLAISDEAPRVNGRDNSVDRDMDQESEDDSGVEQQEGDSDDTEVYNSHNNSSEYELNGKDLGPDPDPTGTVNCHVCNKTYRDNLVLKEHFEKNHPKEMFRCTIRGCDKIFSTRKSRNRHSQNDNLHKHISTAKVNGAL